ncbi:MAG TPA: hypothetical protein VHL11_16860 [Phototrophicaceae bacterium]|jgi:hypothetical protein|nr:hypothetical protein [Phototrophicaceae bacterium]
MTPASAKNTKSIPLLSYHFLALRKGIAAADADRATGRTDSAGWRPGTDVHGWQVADQLVDMCFFERSIEGQTAPKDKNKQRYRITAAGRAAYRPTSQEETILNNLWTALNEATAGGFTRDGWRYWKAIAPAWEMCDQMAGKEWLESDQKSGPQTKGLGHRKYRITAEGCRVIGLPYPPEEQKEPIMANSLELGQWIYDRVNKRFGAITEILPTGNVNIMGDDYVEHLVLVTDINADIDLVRPVDDTPGFVIDNTTGEILERLPSSDKIGAGIDDVIHDDGDTPIKVIDHPEIYPPSPSALDELTAAAAAVRDTIYEQRMAEVDPQTRIDSLQIALQQAENDKIILGRTNLQLENKIAELEKAARLPRADEFADLQKRVGELQKLNDEWRLENNRLKNTNTDLSSNSWKVKFERQSAELKTAQETIQRYQQPDLDTGAIIARLTAERDQLQLQLSSLPNVSHLQAVTPSTVATTPEIEIDYFQKDLVPLQKYAKSTAAALAEKINDGWQVVYEIVQGGQTIIRLQRQKPQPGAPPTDTGVVIQNTNIVQAMEAALSTLESVESDEPVLVEACRSMSDDN